MREMGKEVKAIPVAGGGGQQGCEKSRLPRFLEATVPAYIDE
jgi:hypothetical protein